MLSLESFTPLLGQRFIGLHSGDGSDTHPAALVEACALAPAGRDAQARQPFSLVFEGPAAPIFPQQIYRLAHPTLDAPLELFLVPVGESERGGIRYQAVFT